MEDKFPWPQKGDNPFLVEAADQNSPAWVSLRWLSSLDVDDSYLATAFKESADKVVENIGHGDTVGHPDIFFMPIAYLYRHSFELKIKNIIIIGIEIQLIENSEKLRSIKQKHKLYPLWNYAKRVIEAHWPDSPKEDLSAAERIIHEFHKIDQSGQKLRYTKKLSGQSTMTSLPASAELKQLKVVSDALFNFFEGCEAGLDHAIEMRNEELSYYQDDMFR